VDITEAANRILAEDVKSDTDIPPFNKSAMDGYACRREDLANELTMIETIRAGCSPKETIGPNQCSKIMTGGMVPQDADCVIMKEYVEMGADNTVRFVGEETADNICPRGEDIKAGDIVLRKGTRLRPQHVAVLASVGCAQPLVARRPRVAVIATGDELVEPSAKPAPSQIRDSNSFQLAAQVEQTGAVVTNYGIVKDVTGAIESTFKVAVEENDMVIISGGVSVGDFDLVPGILKQNGVDLLFETIAIKPGKPTVFGLSENVYCFGLPGNPVSTFVLFEILVKPFLYKLMGHDYKGHYIRMAVGEALKRKKVKRQRWLPVRITETGTVKPVEYHGSAHISSLCGADGLVSVDIGIAEIEEGTIVPVRLI
jgi:molybdopterin molybdotransferase